MTERTPYNYYKYFNDPLLVRFLIRYIIGTLRTVKLRTGFLTRHLDKKKKKKTKQSLKRI